MTQYAYTVSDPSSGQRSSGTLIAPDYEAAFRMLTERNYIVTRLDGVASTRSRLLDLLGVQQRAIRDEQVLALTEQMAAMLKAGLTVKQAFEIVMHDTQDPRLRQFLLEMTTSLGAGASLSEVLGRYPEAFDRQYVALVSAGESGGKLSEVMHRLAALIDARIAMRRKLQAAMYYPVFVLVFATAILIGLFVFGVPRFEEIYRGFGSEIPFATQMFMNVAKAMRSHFAALTLLALVLGLACRQAMRCERIAYAIDALKLRLPVFGPLNQRLAIARFSRTLATLHNSGVSIVQALDLVAASMSNRVLEKVVRDARARVIEGESLSSPLRRSRCFTEMSLSMIAAGEHSGALDEMLNNVAEYYEEQVDVTLRALASLVEPAVMVFVGFVVGTVMVALILPIFKLSTVLLMGPK
jgi:type IV pilus assembly protein PilC